MSLQTVKALGQAAGLRALHVASHKILQFRRRSSRPTAWPVYFYPDAPNSRTICYRVLHQLGIKLRKGLPSPLQAAIIFLWRDDTFMEGLSHSEMGEKWIVVNRDCLDISKERVQEVHREVFGYSLEVNPLEYSGRMLMKSNLNGAHDGREVEGPLNELTPGFIYQKIVDNTPLARPAELEARQNVICDIRVPIFGRNADFVYLKYRARQLRYSNANNFVQIVETASILGGEECAKINTFCDRFGLDYGEIDVVRDTVDQKIYILDANKTPFGPPNGLPPDRQAQALQLYEKAFCDWFARLDVVD